MTRLSGCFGIIQRLRVMATLPAALPRLLTRLHPDVSGMRYLLAQEDNLCPIAALQVGAVL